MDDDLVVLFLNNELPKSHLHLILKSRNIHTLLRKNIFEIILLVYVVIGNRCRIAIRHIASNVCHKTAQHFYCLAAQRIFCQHTICAGHKCRNERIHNPPQIKILMQRHVLQHAIEGDNLWCRLRLCYCSCGHALLCPQSDKYFNAQYQQCIRNPNHYQCADDAGDENHAPALSPL